MNLKSIIVYDVCATNAKALKIFKYATERGIEVVIPDNMLKQRNAAKDRGESCEG